MVKNYISDGVWVLQNLEYFIYMISFHFARSISGKKKKKSNEVVWTKLLRTMCSFLKSPLSESTMHGLQQLCMQSQYLKLISGTKLEFSNKSFFYGLGSWLPNLNLSQKKVPSEKILVPILLIILSLKLTSSCFGPNSYSLYFREVFINNSFICNPVMAHVCETCALTIWALISLTASTGLWFFGVNGVGIVWRILALRGFRWVLGTWEIGNNHVEYGLFLCYSFKRQGIHSLPNDVLVLPLVHLSHWIYFCPVVWDW